LKIRRIRKKGIVNEKNSKVAGKEKRWAKRSLQGNAKGRGRRKRTARVFKIVFPERSLKKQEEGKARGQRREET